MMTLPERQRLGVRVLSLVAGKWASMKEKRRGRIAAHVARVRALKRFAGDQKIFVLIPIPQAQNLDAHRLLFLFAEQGVHPGRRLRFHILGQHTFVFENDDQ